MITNLKKAAASIQISDGGDDKDKDSKENGAEPATECDADGGEGELETTESA